MNFDQIAVSAKGDFDGFVAGVSTNLNFNWLDDFSSNRFALPTKIAIRENASFMVGGSYRGTLLINEELIPAMGNYDVFLLSYNTLPTSHNNNQGKPGF